MTQQTVIGLFNKSSDAQDAVQRLVGNGFTKDNVDVSLSRENTGSSNTDFNLDSNPDEHENGVTRFFKNLFGDNDDKDIDKFSKAANRGKSIITVHAQTKDEAERAADIMDDCGAIDVDENADDYSYGSTGVAPVGAFNETTGTTIGTTDTSGAYDNKSNMDITGDSDSDMTNKSIPIIEENIEVGKRMVQTGGVRLRSRIVERPVEEELRLRQEHVYVERNTVDRPASDTDFDTFKEGEVEVTESNEVPVVNKQSRVVEEVSLGKNVEERTETVRETVRKTEVDIEDLHKSNKLNTGNNWKENS